MHSLMVDVLYYCEQDKNIEFMTNKQNQKTQNGYSGEWNRMGWSKAGCRCFPLEDSGLFDLFKPYAFIMSTGEKTKTPIGLC